MARLLLAFAAFLLFSNQVSAQFVSPDASDVVDTVGKLRAIGLPDPDLIEFGPPPKVPGLLRQLNRELEALIIDTLNDSSRRGAPSEEEIFGQLRAAGWNAVPDHKWSAYGEIVKISFDWQLGYDPTVLIVATQLWVPCGSQDPDAKVYVFQGGIRKWNLLISADADFDPLMESEESGVQYHLSPADPSGKFYLAIAHSPPSCRDEPPYVRYEILLPGQSDDGSKTIFSRREAVNDHFKPPFRLQAEADWFSLTRGIVRKLDGEPGVSIARYKISGDQVMRIQPLALTPENFLDEWTQLDWEEASHWSAPTHRAEIEAWHASLHGLANDSAEFESVQACPATGDLDSSWLVTLWIDRQENPSFPQTRLYVAIARHNGTFDVENVRNTTDTSCPGTTAAAKSVDWDLPDW